MLSPGVTRGAIPRPARGNNIAADPAFGAALAVIFGLPAFAAQGRSATALNAQLWSLTGVVVPIVILIALYLRIANLDRSIPFAALALALAALMAMRPNIWATGSRGWRRQRLFTRRARWPRSPLR